MATAVVLSYVLLVAVSVTALTDPALPTIFFPFGTDVGDSVVPVSDHASSPGINIATGFPFFNASRNTVYVNTDGIISFGAAASGLYTPLRLPISRPSTPFIAVYWADVDTTRNDGRIYYRNVTDMATLSHTSQIIRAAYSLSLFDARWALVVTWHNVTFFGARASPPLTNSYQAVLTTDGSVSFVILHYGNLTWTTGILSGGDPDTGLGGSRAVVGFNNGDGSHYYVHPLSHTANIRNICKQSNVAVQGRWVYRVGKKNITGGMPASTTTRSTDMPTTATKPPTLSDSPPTTDGGMTSTTMARSLFTTAAAIDVESSTDSYYQLVVILSVVSAVFLVVIVVVVLVFCFRFKKLSRRTATANQNNTLPTYETIQLDGYTTFETPYETLQEVDAASVNQYDTVWDPETIHNDGYMNVNSGACYEMPQELPAATENQNYDVRASDTTNEYITVI